MRSARAGRIVVGGVPAGLPVMGAAPVAVLPAAVAVLGVVSGVVAVVAVVAVGAAVVLPVMASLAWAAGEGAVRTKVPVSLRGTAFLRASAASCGVTPTVAGVEAVAAGAAVWAEALATISASTAPAGINLM